VGWGRGGGNLATMSFESLLTELRAFVAERDWSQFHDPKNLTMLVASEAGELCAEYRWVRNEDADGVSHQPGARQRIAAEVGDVGLALVLLCDRIGLDLVEAMRAKLALNRQKYPPETSRGRASPPATGE
jgi:dCTP diphosphatase